MIVECDISELNRLIGRELTLERLEDVLFLLKAEIDRVQDDTLDIEINPDRQDMLSVEGIARAVRAFLRIQPGLIDYPVTTSDRKVIVRRGLSKIRPYIACSAVLGVGTSDELIKQYMRLQEALTTTHGRNRRKASIGLYVLDDIEFPVVYRPARPESIRFVPLGHDRVMDGTTILREHDKGIEFGHIIERHSKWPVLMDSQGAVLSLPPIINSNDLGRITPETRNIFVEVTGTHMPTVDQTLNIMTTALAERGGRIESVTTVHPDGTEYVRPDLTPQVRHLSTEEACALTGLELTDAEVAECFRRMGHGASVAASGQVEVRVPAYRMDIMHTVDLIEDMAMGYGFDRITPTMPSTMTAGRPRPVTRLKNKVRDLMVGLGYQEVLSYIMCSPEMMNDKMGRQAPLIETGNPKSREYSVLRNAILPVLIDFAAQNQHAEYPQKVYEVGDVVYPDKDAETRSRQVPSVAALTVANRVNVTGLITELGFVMRNLGLEGRFTLKAVTSPSFVHGRCAAVYVDGTEMGIVGEVAPEVLEAFGLARPAMGFELELPPDGRW